MNRDAIEASFTEAFTHHQAGRLGQAEAGYRHVLSVAPAHADALHLLGLVVHRAGRNDEAIGLIRKAIAVNSKMAAFHGNLGEICRAGGRLAEAEASYRSALAIDPKLSNALRGLGLVLMQLGRPAEAATSYHSALEVDPENTLTINNLGAALQQLDKLDQAIACHRRAIALRPDFARAHANLGAALARSGALGEAVASYRRAVAIDPRDADAPFDLANAAAELGDVAQAEAGYRQAIELAPTHSAARRNYAIFLKSSQRWGDAAAAFEAIVEQAPHDVEALRFLMITYVEQGRIADAVRTYTRLRELAPQRAFEDPDILLAVQYLPDETEATLLAAAQAWDATRVPVPQVAQTRSRLTAARRLKIGYASPDFRQHSCAHFLAPLLAAHNRDAVEVVCFADVRAPDVRTAEFQRQAERWHDTTRLSNDAFAELVHREGIDILVDCAGHTRGGRLAAFGRKPAPVQATWLGFPGTTGLPAIDYRFTDAVADPDDALASEQLIRLACGFLCYAPPQQAPVPAASPAAVTGRVTFGSFNNLAKLSPPALAAWARILAAVPRSRLLLKAKQLGDPPTRALIVERLAKAGIDGDRLELRTIVASPLEHLATYAAVDIALDPFPYNGATTTCEALWMGVPVVALRGERHAARVGASLLTHAGLPELIADSVDGYVAIATVLAQNRQRLAALRAGLRDRMAASALTDARGFAAALEDTYRALWRRWCDSPGADRSS
jgi:protein O-GlcNAc transferase